MQFTCSSCNRELNIPDEKLPDASRFKIKCPLCKSSIVVDRAAARPPTEITLGDDEPEAKKFTPPASTSLEPEIFPPGSKVFFNILKDTEWKEQVAEFFNETGYYESKAKDPHEAVLKLELNDYDVILIQDKPENEVLLEAIGKWSGLKRRMVNVLLVGDAAPSHEPQIAFRKGVNEYLNIGDIDKVGELLHNAIKGYEQYYARLFKAQEKADEIKAAELV